MAHEGSVTKLIGRAQHGDDDAFGELFRRYFPRLVGLARKRLAGIPDPEADEEDAALAAMASFCRCAPAGQFAQLTDRNSLWNLLATITARKVSQQIKRRTRPKRVARLGVRSPQEANNFLTRASPATQFPRPRIGGEGQGEGVERSSMLEDIPLTPTLSPDAGEREKSSRDGKISNVCFAEQPLADELFSHEPTPEDAAMFVEDFNRLLGLLSDPTLQQVALQTLEGYSTTEIAETLGRTKRTVERKLESIRQIWSEELPR